MTRASLCPPGKGIPVLTAVGFLFLCLSFAAAAAQPASQPDEYSYSRRYIEGEVDHYELKARSEGEDRERPLNAPPSHEGVSMRKNQTSVSQSSG